jgi:predicted transglutaminase-like cysteine proteinase
MMPGLLQGGEAGSTTLADVVQAGQMASLTEVPGLFGSIELGSDSLQGLPQWTRVLTVMQAEAPAFDRCLDNAADCGTPVLKNWRKIVTSARDLGRREKLETVNNFFNRWPYKLDSEIYGLSEYWATPREFMTRSGDCEDYSIAKYFALRKLGFSADEMRIVILMDQIRGIGHAVLAIHEGNDTLILDSLSNLILSHTVYKHYAPQYSMNETTRWAHIGSFKKPSTQPYQGLAARN